MASSSSTIFPDQVARLESYTSAICRIVRIADNKPLGTGFLIAPGVVATCHHVVPKAAKPGDCRAEFYGAPIVDQSDLSTRTSVYFEAISFDPDESKCITSPQNFDKNRNLLAADADKLDYSILSLMTNPKLTKVKYFDLFHACTGPMIEQLTSAFVFQHPDIESRDASGLWIKSHELPSSTRSKKKTKRIWNRGEFNLATGPLRTCGEYEIHYAPETAPGSSGGPVTDAMGNLIALHYQGRISQCDCQKSTPVLCNAGVRIDKIVEDLTKTGRRQQVEDLIKQNTLRTQSRLTQHITNFYRDQRSVLMSTKGENLLFPVDGLYRELTIIKKSGSSVQQDNFANQQTAAHQNHYNSARHDGIAQLFKDDNLNNQKRVIVTGVAGVGKTTFSENLAIHGPQILQEHFDTVFLIKLRNLNLKNYPNQGKNYSIEDVLAREYGISLQDSAASSGSSSEGFTCLRGELREFLRDQVVKEKSLMVLDGFDELPDEAHDGQGPLQNVIRELEETFDHILITSRHSDVRFFNSVEMKWRNQFEIIGFNKKSIRDYIDYFYHQLEGKDRIASGSSSKEKAGFYTALEANPILHHFVRIPLNLALACSIFNTNEEVFNSTQNYSLARFYILAVNLLYDRSLRRPGPKQSLKHNPKMDLTLHPAIKPFHSLLQRVAWLAMENGKMQIAEEDVNEACDQAGIDYDVDSIKNIGLMKLESGWEFIHLTFQEYFAALYLANFYLVGTADKKKSSLIEEVKEKIVNIKLNRRYRLMLSIIAGYLSYKATENQRYQVAVKAFFGHFLDVPHELTDCYEPFVISECFDACSDPNTTIQPHYSDFIRDFVTYLHTINDESLLFKLLNRKNKLFQDEEISSFIINRLDDPKRANGMIEVLVRLTSQRQVFPERLIDKLSLIAQNENYDEDVRKKVVEALYGLAKGKTDVALQSIRILAQLAISHVLFVRVSHVLFIRVKAVAALGRLLKDGVDILDFVDPVNLINDLSLDLTSRAEFCFGLSEMAKRKRDAIPGDVVVDHLAMIAQDPCLDHYTKKKLIDELMKLMDALGMIFPSVPERLFSILEQTGPNDYLRMDDYLRSSLVSALRFIAEKEAGFFQDKLSHVLSKVIHADIEIMEKDKARRALTWLAQIGGRITECILESLFPILQNAEGCPTVRADVEEIIIEISKTKGLISLDWVRFLRAIVEDPNVLQGIEEIVSVLANIAEKNSSSAVEAINALVMIIEEPRYGYPLKKAAISALAKVRQEIPLKDVNSLLTMLQDPMLDTPSVLAVLNVLAVLKKIVPSNATAAIEATKIILKIIEEVQPYPDSHVFKASLSVLEEVVTNHQTVALFVLDELERMVCNSMLTTTIRKELISCLKTFNWREPFEQAKSLIDKFDHIINRSDVSPEIKGYAAIALSSALKRGATLSLKEWGTLILILHNSEIADKDITDLADDLVQFLRDKSSPSIRKTMIDRLNLLRKSPECKPHVKMIIFHILLSVDPKSANREILNEIHTLIQESTRGHLRITSLLFVTLQFIAWENKDSALEAINIAFEVLQNTDMHMDLRLNAAQSLGFIAEKVALPDDVVTTILQSERSDPSFHAKEWVLRSLGRIVKQGVPISKRLLDNFIDFLFALDLKQNAFKSIVGALADILEQGGEIARETLHALVMMHHYNGSAAYIEDVLRKINSRSLLNVITDPPSFQLVFRVCLLTSRSLVLFEGKIYLSDDHQQISEDTQFTIEEIEWMSRLVGRSLTYSSIFSRSPSLSSLPDSSSASSIGSSLSPRLSYSTSTSSSSSSEPTSSAPISIDHQFQPTHQIFLTEAKDPYLRLDDIFTTVYASVLREQELSSLMTSLIDNQTASNVSPKDILVDYLISECVKAANQDEQFTELKKIVSYVSIFSLEKMAHYYSIRKSSSIEKSLERIGLFTPKPTLKVSQETDGIFCSLM